MVQLGTIQKVENLNEVYTVDEEGNGGANHEYAIFACGSNGKEVGHIQFQNGARKLDDSISGVLDTDLLEIVRHRLQCFQDGKFANGYNAKALESVEKALLWLNKRVEDRIERDVLGTNNK